MGVKALDTILIAYYLIKLPSFLHSLFVMKFGIHEEEEGKLFLVYSFCDSLIKNRTSVN